VPDSSTINLSYFGPRYYKLFAKIDTTPPAIGLAVVDTMYTVLNASLNSSNGNTGNGCTPLGVTAAASRWRRIWGGFGRVSDHYQYDSCRVPFRIGLDWCWNGETRAQSYVALTSKSSMESPWRRWSTAMT